MSMKEMKTVTVTDAGGRVLGRLKFGGAGMLADTGAATMLLAGALDVNRAGDIWDLVSQAASIMSVTPPDHPTPAQTIARNVLHRMAK